MLAQQQYYYYSRRIMKLLNLHCVKQINTKRILIHHITVDEYDSYVQLGFGATTSIFERRHAAVGGNLSGVPQYFFSVPLCKST
jgi:hypothetical protein